MIFVRGGGNILQTRHIWSCISKDSWATKLGVGGPGPSPRPKSVPGGGGVWDRHTHKNITLCIINIHQVNSLLPVHIVISRVESNGDTTHVTRY